MPPAARRASVPLHAAQLLRRAALPALLCAACAGPDLGPTRGRKGPWWVADPVLSSAVGAVQDTRTHHAQKRAQRPVVLRAAGEREQLLNTAATVLRTHGFALRPRLVDEPLHTVRRDGGLPYGTVGSRPAVLTRSYALSAVPVADASSQWELSLRVEVERCVAEEPAQPELQRACNPLSDVSPELQQELDALGSALREALAPGTAARP